MNIMSEKKYSEQDENGRVIGEIVVVKNKTGEGSYLNGLIVDINHRNMGVGGRLIDQAIEDSTHPIALEVRSDNLVAIAMYKKRGFVVVETVTAKDGTVYSRMRKD